MKKKHLIILIFFSIFNNLNAQNDTLKSTKLEEVIIKEKKKAVEQKADRTIYNFSGQAYLNSGTLMEGLKKLPGLIISDIAGMMYQGKQLEVYMDSRPTNMYSDELNTFLESLPANSIEKVEIITQPGAEFPATSGGAIINIITSKKSKKYVTINYSNGYSNTNYDKNRNKYNNSVLINAKNNILGWQIQVGQSHNESYQKTVFESDNTLLSNQYFDKQNRYYFLKTAMKFDFKKDRLLLNYDINTNNNDANVDANGFGFTSKDDSESKRYRSDVMLVYQKRFKNNSRKLDFILNFNKNSNNFEFRNRGIVLPVLDNDSKQIFYQFKTDFSQELQIFEKSKISLGVLADQLIFETKAFHIQNLEYFRKTISGYTEFQSSYNDFDFILGARLESYHIGGNTPSNKLNPFVQMRVFPNVTFRYNVLPQVFVNANYNQKISLPNTATLNPNNTDYQNQNINYYGNPNLDPTLYSNFEFKISAMEYFFVGYSRNDAKNQVVNRIIETSNGIAKVSENEPKISVHNFNFGLPIPFMLFTKGLKETLKLDFNPDEINFFNLYLDYQKYKIEQIETKGFWSFNLMSQIILPGTINFTTNYNTSTTGGNYYFYLMRKPFYEQVDITLSKKFLSNNLSISIYADDIFDTNRQDLKAVATSVVYHSQYDTRKVGFSINYKISSKNKTINEENILTNEKKEEKLIEK